MIKTPFYYYDLKLLQQTLSTIKTSIKGQPYKIHYALKANVEGKILEIIQKAGFGADCVSGNEVTAALKYGFKPSEIVLAGVGKTDDEIELAISNELHSINCESIEEIKIIAQIANGRKVHVALRVNPNIKANTLPEITTGTSKNKFGIPSKNIGVAIEEIYKHDCLNFIGLHFHIGSQITDLEDFVNLVQEVNQIQSYLQGKKINLPHLNLGGGLGINYIDPLKEPIPNFKEYFEVFKNKLDTHENQTIHFELGRSIIAQSASLISKVLYVKNGSDIKFVIIDGGMTDLMRPALYNSTHFIENLSSKNELEEYEVVGPICESTDTFGKAILPKTQRGDYIKIHSTGAYGQVLSSNYNLRSLPKAIYSDHYQLSEIMMCKVI